MAKPNVAKLLDTLESFYGTQRPVAPADPYEFLIWWQCGYPPSEERCEKGWKVLKDQIGLAPKRLLSSSVAKLAKILAAGGMVPRVRAERIKEVAACLGADHGGDLLAGLARLTVPQARKALKAFPGIGNPGADRILLFARISPAAAVPSACPHVLVRIAQGSKGEDYSSAYAAAQLILDALPAEFDARIRAYLLLSRHGRELCKRSNPACERCPLRSTCAFAKKARKQP